MFHSNLFIPTHESYLRIYKIQYTIFYKTICMLFLMFLTTYEIYLACLTFENVVRVTTEQNGSVTVINSAKNTKKCQRDGQ
jgi:hypothetical protein